MKIAELFVDLGVKGESSASKALKNTKGSLDDIFSSGLAAKAAIVGVVYGLQQLMGNSAQAGTNLSNFNALTGISTQKLQQWQYAARQVGVSNEELAGSFKAVQNSVTNMLLGKGAPEGYAMIANKVGLDEKRLRDTEYVMKQLQEFAKTVPPDVGNQMLKSFGLSEGTIAAMRKNAFNQKVFAQAPLYSQGEINQLSKVNSAWSNLGNKIEMAMGHFTAKHGMQMVRDIGKITDSVIKLAEALERVSTKFGLFEKLAQSLEGVANTLNLFNEIFDTIQNGEANKNNKMIKKQQGEWFPGFSNSPLGQFLGMEKVAPETKAPVQNKTNNTTINQNLNFQHSGKDAQKTGESVNKAARDAVRTSQAQAQVN